MGVLVDCQRPGCEALAAGPMKGLVDAAADPALIPRLVELGVTELSLHTAREEGDLRTLERIAKG